MLDVDTANVQVLKWLRDVANSRVHRTTQAVPADLLEQERQALQPLPVFHADQPKPVESVPMHSWPVESLQRSPEEYEQLLGANL